MSSPVKIGRGLREFTPARVGLASAGTSIATEEQLRFQLDHALARDAVHARLDIVGLLAGVGQLGLEGVALRSAVEAGPGERQTYLRRPDLGRQLGAKSIEAVEGMRVPGFVEPDVVFAIADGLSALAVERHALPLLAAVMAAMERDSWRVGPVCIVSQGRVAVGDEIGERLGARLVVMLIGERPGLSAADSLGVYITWDPRVGRTDAERNCVSNVRLEGLGYSEAARQVVALMQQARRLALTGVGLKRVGDGLLREGPLIP